MATQVFRHNPPRILLSSVFGPYARDDEFGSRAINPMELYHNQVTRAQGGFSLRMFHRSFGLMLLQANIDAPCTLLDFPTLDRFRKEIRKRDYDIVGISSIIPNVAKVAKMCTLVRESIPRATIVVGGHVANKPDVRELVDADHVVKGDGVAWFRRLLGQDDEAPVRHPLAYSGFAGRVMGMTLRGKPRNTAAVLIPSVGCPVGCNFCSTSAMFGGKGRFINFYETGDELFSVMCQIEKKLRVRSFFVMDENFLLHRKRALRLLELMEEHEKSWSLYVFSSGRVLRSYSIEQLVRLGVSWVWMGLEGENSQYKKLKGVDTRAFVRELQSHGIRVLGSSIIGMEDHSPENIDSIIDYAVSHSTDFHQFMLYTPVPGTALYDQHLQQGTLIGDDRIPPADTHGQDRFNFHHEHIHDGRESEFLMRAFRRDFEINGPSIARLARTTLRGWQAYKNHPDKRIRSRFLWEARELARTYAGVLWASRRWFRNNRNGHVSEKLSGLYSEITEEFGLKARALGPLLGRIFLHSLRREEKRLVRGRTYEPRTKCERSARAVRPL